MSPLLNYTTKVPVDKTVGEIQRILVGAGARNVSIDYERELPTALAFTIATPIGPYMFRLPADTDAAWRVLTQQARAHKLGRSAQFFTKEQAGRVAWRIVKDWLEAQLALIDLEMARLEEVMMPYLVMENGRTLYEGFRDKQLSLPAARTEGAL
jgi:hypothetical protein